MKKNLLGMTLALLASFSLSACGEDVGEYTNTYCGVQTSVFNDLGDHTDYNVYTANMECLNSSDSAINFSLADFTLRKGDTVLHGTKFLTGYHSSSETYQGKTIQVTIPEYDEESWVVLARYDEVIKVVFAEAIDNTYNLYVGESKINQDVK